MTMSFQEQKKAWRPELDWRGALREGVAERLEGKSDEELAINDVVGWAYNKSTNERESFFPSVGICHQCNGPKTLYFGWPFVATARTVARPDLACQVRAIAHGSSMRSWDNPVERLTPCNCKGRLEELLRELNRLGLFFFMEKRENHVAEERRWIRWRGYAVLDSFWNLDEHSSRPQRGIRDYRRTFVVPREPSVGELELVREWLQHDQCPGWTGISLGCKPQGETGEFLIHCSTTWDSSD